MSWAHHAACKDRDVNVFFPHNREGYARAKLICSECPVRTACLDWALSHPPQEDRGVFGGTDHRQRLLIRDAASRFGVRFKTPQEEPPHELDIRG